MKKNFIIFLSVALILGWGTAAMAAYDVRTAITSPEITGAQNSCEKYGAVTFTFQENNIIKDGDWIYFDLPLNVALCNDFRFLVLGNAGGGVAGTSYPTGITLTSGGLQTAVPVLDGDSVARGAWKIIDLGSQPAQFGIKVQEFPTPAAPAIPIERAMYVLVSGSKEQRRISLQFFDDESATSLTDAVNQNGNSAIMVGGDTNLTLTLFDGEPWSNLIVPATPKNPNNLIYALKDTNNDGKFGNAVTVGADTLQHPTLGNVTDNFICAKILIPDYANVVEQYINVSFFSGGRSGDAFLTFQGQREIAHIMSSTFTLEGCAKRLDCGNIPLNKTGQTQICAYNYNTPAAAGYCPDPANSTNLFFSVGNPGNKFIISTTNASGFGSDQLYIALTIKGTGAAGTYFANGGAASYNASNNTTFNCTASTGMTAAVALGGWFAADGTAVATWGDGTGCAVAAAAPKYIQSGRFTLPADARKLVVDIPPLVYTPALLKNGDVAEVQIEIRRLPCGSLFTGSRCVATYISTCAAATPSTTLLYPYSVPLNDTNWWFGMSVCNPSATAGTATLTIYEQNANGTVDTATLPIASIPAGGMVVLASADLAAATPAAANTGTIGDNACHIVVTCNFGFAGGFGMMGNAKTGESTGYTANGVAGTVAAPWNY